MSSSDDAIADLSTAGHLLASGQFSVDAERARRLLRQSALSDPTAYLLKWVQAAINYSCAEVHVRSHPQSIRVAGIRDISSPDAVSDSDLFFPGCPIDSDLGVGLLAASHRLSPIEVCLSGTAYRFEGGKLLESPATEATDPREFSVAAHVVNQDWHSSLSHRERCCFSPALVHWSPDYSNQRAHLKSGGGRLAGIHLLQRYIPDQELTRRDAVCCFQPEKPTVLVAAGQQHVDAEPSSVLLRIVDSASTRVLRVPVNDDWLGRSSAVAETPLCKTIVIIPATLCGLGSIHFVKSGVTLNTIAVDLGCPGAVVIASAANLAVDLSQFEVVRDEAFVVELQRIRQIVRESAALIAPHLHLLRPPLSGWRRLLPGLSSSERSLQELRNQVSSRLSHLSSAAATGP